MRVLSDDEICRLLAVSEKHSLIYGLVLLTGLRRSELAALQWRDLSLEASQPSFTLRPETAQDGRARFVPLHASLQPGFSGLAGGSHAPNDPVFGPMPSTEDLRRDLSAAGVRVADRTGHLADFHSLRETYQANLHRAGVHPAPYWKVETRRAVKSSRLGQPAKNGSFPVAPATWPDHEAEAFEERARLGQKKSRGRSSPAPLSRNLTLLLLTASRSSHATLLILALFLLGAVLGLGWLFAGFSKPVGVEMDREILPDESPSSQAK
jgi:hypothetical protein